MLTKTETNPGKHELPTNATGGAKPGHIDWGTTVVPQAEFDIDFAAPPARLRPGAKITFRITVTGKLTGEKTLQGFRGGEAILLVNDRWIGGAVGAFVNCVDPIGAAPITCKESDAAKGELSSTAPTYGETFTIGIGVLNCGPCYVRYTYTATKGGAPPPPPKPPAPLPPGSTGDLIVDYTRPARFGLPGPKGMIQYHDTIGEIRPDHFRVEFTVKRKDGKRCQPRYVEFLAPRAIRKGSNKVGISSVSRGACLFFADYRQEGRYTVQATFKRGGAFTDPEELQGRLRFDLQDWLIVGLGDSNGSGEGAPDVSSGLTVRWQNRQCHRSARSYQAQTALLVEQLDPKTSVTFVHLSCSGATIPKGILGKYEGIEPKQGKPLRSQIGELRRLIGGREVDAMMVSIGVNDLRFGPMVAFCISNDDCPSQKFPNKTSPRTLAQAIQLYLAQLPHNYAKVATAFQKAGIKPERIYFSEYFDSTKDRDGRTCNPLIWTPAGSFDRAEAQWAHDRVLVPLNTAVATATARHRWNSLDGAYRAFRRHGYCAKPAKTQSWIVNLTASAWQQFNKEGTLHSTPRGNEEQARFAASTVRPSLYPGGRTRPPREAR